MVPIMLPLAVWAVAICGNSSASVSAKAPARKHTLRLGILRPADVIEKGRAAEAWTAGIKLLELGILATHYDRLRPKNNPVNSSYRLMPAYR